MKANRKSNRRPSLTFKHPLPRHRASDPPSSEEFTSGIVRMGSKSYPAVRGDETGSVWVFLKLGGWREINEVDRFESATGEQGMEIPRAEAA